MDTRRKSSRPRRSPLETETLTIFLARQDRDETLVRLETVSRQRRRDRDHNTLILTQEQEDILKNLLLRDVTMMFESIHFVLELSTYGIVYLMK